MRKLLAVAMLPLLALPLRAQVSRPGVPAGRFEVLDFLLREAAENNPELRAAAHRMDESDARAASAGIPGDPEFTYMREQMPGFAWNRAPMERFEVMQMIPFPTRLAGLSAVANIQAEHAHHDHLEKFNEVSARIHSMFAELWYAQHAGARTVEHLGLLGRIMDIARARYGAGLGTQPEVLRLEVETSRTSNLLAGYRRQELGTKAMLGALLGRAATDTLANAWLSDSVSSLPSLEALQRTASRTRPMVLHDSLMIDERRALRALLGQELLPDLKIGVQWVRMPLERVNSWGLIAGITVPLAPWSLARTGYRKEEADAGIRGAEESYRATRLMVGAAVAEAHSRARTAAQQLAEYRERILPRTRQSLQAVLATYQGGRSDFLTVIDAYRMVVDASLDALMIRMQFEQALADLKRSVGRRNLMDIPEQEN